jgi:hypothetical protein
MPKLCVLVILFGLVLVGAATHARAGTGENVEVRAGINHDDFDRLLKKYVDEQGLVNCGGWKQNATHFTGAGQLSEGEMFSS